MSVELIANVVGSLALLLSVWGLVRKTNDKLLIILSVSVLVWGVHYFLMNSIVGGIMHLIAAIGIFVADRMQSRGFSSRFWMASLFVALNLITGVVWWTGHWDAYAMAAAPILVYSQFCLKGHHMRMGFMAGEVAMFFYASALGSVPGMAVAMINLAAGAAGLTRMLLDNKSRVETVRSEVS